eukprot:UN12892
MVGNYFFVAYKPRFILLAHRMKDEAKEIIESMSKYGILCELQDRYGAVLSANNWNTDCDGWNHLQSVEELKSNRKKFRKCGNSKCKMTRNILWEKYRQKFRKCSGCQRFSYCSKKCQKYHWIHEHRVICLKRKYNSSKRIYL